MDALSPSEAAESLARYERLLAISGQLNAILDLDELLELIVTTARDLLHSEAASILLLDRRTGVLRFEAGSDPQGMSLEAFEVPIQGSFAGWVVTNGETIVVDDVSTDPRHFTKVDEASKFVTRLDAGGSDAGARQDHRRVGGDQ